MYSLSLVGKQMKILYRYIIQVHFRYCAAQFLGRTILSAVPSVRQHQVSRQNKVTADLM